eukprot:Hpha_TRINITY_DN9202_c0_g1::TRINITY_DN9202_c0_g1_i1::g.28855::m.28855
MRTINVSDTVRVLVTAASDFVPGWIIRLLLEEGFTVRATLPDLASPPHNLDYIRALGVKHEGRLELAQLDLIDDDSLLLQNMLSDCEFVVHSLVYHPRGTPPRDTGGEGMTGLEEGSIEAVRRLLQAGVQCPRLRRILLSASTAVMCNAPATDPDDPHVWGEDDRNEEPSSSYLHAEVAAELTAWMQWVEIGRKYPRKEKPGGEFQEVTVAKEGG